VTNTTEIGVTTVLRRMIGIIAAFALVAVCFFGWVWMTTSVSDTPIPARQVVFNAAIVSYRVKNGSAPASLVSLTPVLDEFTRSKCCIVKIGEDRYRVWVGLDRLTTEQFEVDYKLGKDGFREKCHVYKIRKFHHRK